MADAIVQVEGLRQLQRAFRAADRTLHLELRSALRDVAEPVRADAERLAVSAIPRIGLPWSRMRIGVTQRAVYVAPKQRGVKTRGWDPRRRPNFADLMVDRVMDPTRERNQARVLEAMEDMLDTVGKAWERA